MQVHEVSIFKQSFSVSTRNLEPEFSQEKIKVC